MRPLILAGITSLAVLLAGALHPELLSAQCGDCEVQYYPGDECWMEGCWVTYGHGHYTSCGQQGSCGAETCTTSGEICLPHQTLLDGRGAGWIGADLLERLTRGELPGISIRGAGDFTFYRRVCSGALVYADYDGGRIEELRRQARRIEI